MGNQSIDVVISNCVVNLAPDKSKVFREAHRTLKKGGRMYFSDIVLLKNFSETQRNDDKLIAGCVGRALFKDDYLKIIKDAGFEVNVLSEDKDISKRQYGGAPPRQMVVLNILSVRSKMGQTEAKTSVLYFSARVFAGSNTRLFLDKCMI